MIMTEATAQNFWCPETRIQMLDTRGGAVTAVYGSSGHNRHVGAPTMIDPVPPGSGCLGRRCAWWQPIDAAGLSNSIDPELRRAVASGDIGFGVCGAVAAAISIPGALR